MDPAVYLSIPSPGYGNIWAECLNYHLPVNDHGRCVYDSAYIRLSSDSDTKLLYKTIRHLKKSGVVKSILLETDISFILSTPNPNVLGDIDRLILRVDDPSDIPNILGMDEWDLSLDLSLDLTLYPTGGDGMGWPDIDWGKFYSVAIYPDGILMDDLITIQDDLRHAGLARQDAYLFGRPGTYMPHVWRAGTIIGIGPGAYSAGWDGDKRWRIKNAEDVKKWGQSPAKLQSSTTLLGQKSYLSADEKRFEVIQNSLPHVDGITDSWLKTTYDVSIDWVIPPTLQKRLITDGLAEKNKAGTRFKLTDTGLNQFDKIGI